MTSAGVKSRMTTTLGTLICLAASGLVGATSLEVKASAARAGGYGLEVAVGTSCTSDQEAVVPAGGISDTRTYEGCRTVTAGDVDVLAGADVTLRAGDRVVLGNGFSVANGSAFTAAISPALTGRGFVQDDSPTAEGLYRARFYLDPANLTAGPGDGFEHFAAYTGAGVRVFDLRLEESGADLALVATARDGSGTSSVTAAPALPASYFAVEVEWKASDPGAANGSLRLWVDGAQVTGLSGLDNATFRVDSVRWGVVDGLESTTTGSMNLDEFLSQRSAVPIGLLP